MSMLVNPSSQLAMISFGLSRPLINGISQLGNLIRYALKGIFELGTVLFNEISEILDGGKQLLISHFIFIEKILWFRI